MDKHNIAKKVLFCEIASNVGIYEDIGKIQKDILKGNKNSGTHLLDSIEQSWSSIAVNGDAKLNCNWNSILVSNGTKNQTMLEISKIISSKFFGLASNEKLEMLVYEGVVNARNELVRGNVLK